MAQSLLRLPAVIERTGYRRSSIYSLIRRGEFPAPIELGPRLVAWPSDLIDEWVQARIDAGGAKRNNASTSESIPEAA